MFWNFPRHRHRWQVEIAVIGFGGHISFFLRKPLAERDLTVAVGFIPRKRVPWPGVAERRLKFSQTRVQPSLRDGGNFVLFTVA
jgi:hypothetical protein